jgi:hypothetical protein
MNELTLEWLQKATVTNVRTLCAPSWEFHQKRDSRCSECDEVGHTALLLYFAFDFKKVLTPNHSRLRAVARRERLRLSDYIRGGCSNLLRSGSVGFYGLLPPFQLAAGQFSPAQAKGQGRGHSDGAQQQTKGQVDDVAAQA